MSIAKKLRVFVGAGVLLSLINPITPVAHAAPACSPTSVAAPTNGTIRNYLFKGAGTCDWTVPTGFFVKEILLIGGGGGGGGGSWKGLFHGGGGGGGGGGGDRYFKTLTYLSAGTVIPVTVGAGGTAGSGASSQNSNGTAGGDGGSTSFSSLSVDGGLGGAGGGDDTGGTGGTSGRTINSAGNPGGNQDSGNGGGGASSAQAGFNGINATSSTPGGGMGGSTKSTSTYVFPSGFTFGGGGIGGAAGSNEGNYAASATRAAQSAVGDSGDGGSGGHGCAQGSSTCANRDGTPGASGQILVSITWGLSDRDAANYNMTKVGKTVSFRPFWAPEPIGTGTWSASNLPPGLSINSSTGEVTGTPTASTNFLISNIRFSDSAYPDISIAAQMASIISKGVSTYQPVDQVLEYGKSVRVSVESILGSATTSISTSAFNWCQISGPRNETITALRSSGTCQIVITNAGDIGYESYYKIWTLTLAKQNHTISLSKSTPSDIEVGTPITLTTTVNSGVTGTVQFFNGDTLISTCGTSGNVTISGTQATCTWTPTSTSGSPYSIKSKYLGATNYAASTSSPVTQVVRPSIVLSYSGSTSVFGNSATISPSVSGGTGDPSTWTWGIKKTSDNSSVSGISISSSGVVSVASNLASGTYAMTVNVTDAASITKSAPITIYVAPSTPTVIFNRPSKIEVTKGQTISLSATLPSDASGTVTFKYGQTAILACGTNGQVTISAGSATCNWNTSQVTASQYDMTASYSGGGNYNATNSNPLSMTVHDRALVTYADITTDYKIATSATPVITPNTGTGDPSNWTWAVVKRSDSSTVSGISIDSTGLLSIGNDVGAGSYVMSVSVVDLADDTTTVTVNITVNKVRPVLTISPRMTSGALSPEATVNRQLYWKVESTHRSSSQLTLYIDGTSVSCGFFSIAFGDGQCWWSPTNAGSTISAYVSFPGDSNLETATSNVITDFKVNGPLSLSYSDTSTYAGFATQINPVTSGGTGAKRFGISQYFTGAQIPGISIDSSTGVISVSRSTIVGNYRMTVSIMDEANASNFYNDLYINVLDQVAPSFTLSSSSETVNKNSYINGFTLLHSSTPGTNYTISPNLPAGLSFSSTSGLIHGAPTVASSSTNYTITASNIAGSSTATFALTVSENLVATISIAVGSNPAAKGTPNTIVATISAAGKVQFYVDGKKVPGCISLSGTTSVTCNWKPSRMGSATVKATLKPTNVSIPAVTSSSLQVGIGRRTGSRS